MKFVIEVKREVADSSLPLPWFIAVGGQYREFALVSMTKIRKILQLKKIKI
jgi:hypothetical protein